MKIRTLANLITLGTNAFLIMENKDAAKKVAYMAAGLASISKQKIEEMAKEISENSQMTEEEGKKFVDEIISKSKEAKEELEQKIEEITKSVFKRMNIATTDDIKRLEKKIEMLSKKK